MARTSRLVLRPQCSGEHSLHIHGIIDLHETSYGASTFKEMGVDGV
jgi:hypothetical protein